MGQLGKRTLWSWLRELVLIPKSSQIFSGSPVLSGGTDDLILFDFKIFWGEGNIFGSVQGLWLAPVLRNYYRWGSYRMLEIEHRSAARKASTHCAIASVPNWSDFKYE